MSAQYSRLKGFADIYGAQLKRFTLLEDMARQTFFRYGFEELRTPILEPTALFLRSIGEQTDVVQKEMFTFSDRKGRSMTMRPEATAGVMRAAIEENLVRQGQVSRFFSIGPMFRYERPQKGRMRQFHQINCECLGSDSPYADADLICMLMDFLHHVGLKKLKLKINSLGCKKCRPAYMEKLQDFLRATPAQSLCGDCLTRREANPLRVLDCKQPGCREVCAKAPKLLDHACADCKSHMELVLTLLEKAGIAAEIDASLVRGLDYYMRTTFEVVSNEIGAQTAVAGGGRYDGLVAQLGGPDIPGVGFACGMERLALLLNEAEPAPLDFFLLVPDASERQQGFQLLVNLRKQGFSGEMNFGDAGFKSLMRQANRSGARSVLIFGPDEAAQGSIAIKNLATGEQINAPLDALPAALARVLGK